MTQPLHVDIWSDIACPWCYLGKHRFEQGAEQFTARTGREVTVEYHSFELTPGIPPDWSGNQEEFFRRFTQLDPSHIVQANERIAAMGAELGLAYDFPTVVFTNTLKAHQVLHLAKADGKQLELKELLLKAHFADGRNIGDEVELAEIAAEAGLDRKQVLDALRANTFADVVSADIKQAKAYGISGVPFFVIDGRYGVSGAQSVDTFAEALTQASLPEQDQ